MNNDKGPVYDSDYAVLEERDALEKESKEKGVAVGLDTTMVNGAAVPTVLLALRGHVAALLGTHGARSLARTLDKAANMLDRREKVMSELDTLCALVEAFLPTLNEPCGPSEYVEAKENLEHFMRSRRKGHEPQRRTQGL